MAVVGACEHFHVYIFGKPVTVYTDHQPLLGLFGKPRAKLPMRLERWSLRLQPYSPVIKYRRGSDNPADYLSRHPLSVTKQDDKLTEQYVNFVTNQTVPRAMTYDEVNCASKDDPTLCIV